MQCGAWFTDVLTVPTTFQTVAPTFNSNHHGAAMWNELTQCFDRSHLFAGTSCPVVVPVFLGRMFLLIPAGRLTLVLSSLDLVKVSVNPWFSSLPQAVVNRLVSGTFS